MKEEDQRLFQALDTLRDAAWQSFDRRRTYEWKFCIAVWTSMAVFSGTLITTPPGATLAGAWPVVLTGLVGVLITSVHAYWSKGLSEANTADRRVSYVYEKRMCLLIGVSHADEVLPLVQPRQGRMGKLSNYSHLSQVVITGILAAAAVCAMWARAR